MLDEHQAHYIRQCITNVSLIIKPFINHFKANISDTLNSTCFCIQYIHPCTELREQLWGPSSKAHLVKIQNSYSQVFQNNFSFKTDNGPQNIQWCTPLLIN